MRNTRGSVRRNVWTKMISKLQSHDSFPQRNASTDNLCLQQHFVIKSDFTEKPLRAGRNYEGVQDKYVRASQQSETSV